MKQRMYPVERDLRGLRMHTDHVRFLYNLGLEQRSMWRPDKHARGPLLSAARVWVGSQKKELTVLRTELDWLREGSSSVQQEALRDLDRAFGSFFAGRGRYPTFKRRDDRNGGFYIRDLSVRRVNKRWGQVHVPKVGWVRFRLNRPWTVVVNASSARVSLRNGQWHISFITPASPPVRTRERLPATGAVIGVDRGIANTLATSNGRFDHAPSWTDGEQARFLALQQRLARQTTAAKKHGRRLSECVNRGKTLDQLARLRQRLDNRRTDWLEQTTTRLARDYDLIVLEKLNVANMVRRPAPQPDPVTPGRWLPNRARAKAGLNRAIYAQRWAEHATRLNHKTIDGQLVFVDPRFTSQQCHACGHTDPGNRESQAVFECARCAHTNHADTNAALNILTRGLATQPQPEDIGGSPALVTPQEPEPGAIPATLGGA